MPHTFRIAVRRGEPLKLPDEAVAALGDVSEAYLTIDPDAQKITITARHPERIENEAILDQIAELHEGMSLEEYTEPVPESFLDRRGKRVDKESS